MSWIELSEFARNIALILLGMVGTYVALQGLSTWKRQEEWKRNSEVASAVFESLLAYRDAIDRFRTRKVTSEEVERYLNGDEVFKGTLLEYFEIMEPILEQRFNMLEEAVRETQLSIERARFLWGDDLKDEYTQIFASVGAISSFLKTVYTSVPFLEPKLRTVIVAQLEKDWGTVLEGEDGAERFENELTSNVEAIEKDLRARVGMPG